MPRPGTLLEGGGGGMEMEKGGRDLYLATLKEEERRARVATAGGCGRHDAVIALQEDALIAPPPEKECPASSCHSMV